ncbi:hypothetical protein LCGC14_1619470 [marine sediment metagenome]|uniref:Uncharacterized protein n=1 Tax=marine sediment metagenome TaxID=412755 RepID=A0A0F9I678_9ZZZZ
MPFNKIGDLPPTTKNLPRKAKEIFMAAFNNAHKQHPDDEARVNQIAWAAVKRQYKHSVDGQWVAKEAKVDITIHKGNYKEAMSDNDRRQLLQGAVTASLAIGNNEVGPFLRDVYATEVVYEIGSKMFKMAYVIDAKGKVVFGEAERVKAETVYTPIQEKVEAKINELTLLASERQDNGEVQQSINNLLEIIEKEDLDEKTAGPLLLEADEVIAECEKAAVVKTEEGEQYPQSAYAYTPDEKPESWKLRLWENPSKGITKNQLQKVAAYLSPGGYRGDKVVILKESLPVVKQRIRAEFRKLGIDDGAIPKWVRETDETRSKIQESCEIDIQEVTKEGIAKGIVPIRIISPGFNTSKGRYYSEQAIKDAAVLFDGAKMYADHPTETEEKEKPERSIRDWVATLHETKVSKAGNAVGIAHINAGWLKEKIQSLFELGDLQHLGTSINAVGKGTSQTIEGHKTTLVEGLVRSTFQSVDFVTEAGAGGQAGLRESAIDSVVDADLIDLATLREARPDLVEAIEATIRDQIQTEVKKKMDAEARITELEGQNEELTTENSTLKEEKVQREKEKAKEEAQTAIKDAVDKAELPDLAKTKLIEAHKDDESAEGIDEFIKTEVEYIAALSEKGEIKNLGPAPEKKNKEKTKRNSRKGSKLWG